MKKILTTLLVSVFTITAAQGQNKYSKELEKKALSGDVIAQNNLGVCYSEGNGVAKDNKEALKWYLKAANQGYKTAQYNLALDYYHGNDAVGQDYVEAAKWFTKAAEQNDKKSQYMLGIIYHFGYGVEKNYTQAFKWFEKAAKQGDATSQFYMGWYYGSGNGVAQDYKQSVNWYHLASEKGNASAYYNMGVYYLNGQGVDKDYEQACHCFYEAAQRGYDKALEWLKSRAQQGKIEAQYYLACTFYSAKDYTHAIEWFKKAADQGDNNSMDKLGIIYEEGIGVGKDFNAAEQYYLKAANNGSLSAMNNLAILYTDKLKQHNKALEWFNKAVKEGYAEAYRNIAVMYYFGDAVGVDYSKVIDYASEYLIRANIKDESNDSYLSAFWMLEDVCAKHNSTGKYNTQLASKSNVFDLFNKAVLSESHEAINDFGLGFCYAYGIGISKDIDKAKSLFFGGGDYNTLYDKSCFCASVFIDMINNKALGNVTEKQKYNIAQIWQSWDGEMAVIVAKAMIEGKIVKKDVQGAINTLKLVIRNNDNDCPVAEYELAKYYINNDVKQHYSDAFKLLKHASANEDARLGDAMNLLNTCYRFGLGTTKDLKLANYWLNKAEQTGSNDANLIKRQLAGTKNN